MREWRLVLYTIAVACLWWLMLGCRAPVPMPQVAPPVPAEAAFLIHLRVDDAVGICLEQFPSALEPYKCTTVGELRRWVQTHYEAD